jgi:hypothetical protein
MNHVGVFPDVAAMSAAEARVALDTFFEDVPAWGNPLHRDHEMAGRYFMALQQRAAQGGPGSAAPPHRRPRLSRSRRGFPRVRSPSWSRTCPKA